MKKKQLKPAATKLAMIIKTYLIAYNSLSLIAWATVFYHLVSLYLDGHYSRIYLPISDLVKYTQTFALIEVLNTALRLVRASVFTTAIQVASRLLLVWAISDNFPNIVGKEIAYPTMILAWSITEVVRYGYYIVTLFEIELYPLLWMR
jgi:very-long-chain (3R)-3-hydroxyacyl-CoA dehydratase